MSNERQDKMRKRLAKLLRCQNEVITMNGGNFKARHTLAELEKVYDANNGLCAICGSPPGKRKLQLDHCHASGKLRGLLCHSCNVGLGSFKDDKEVMLRAIRYLEEHSTK